LVEAVEEHASVCLTGDPGVGKTMYGEEEKAQKLALSGDGYVTVDSNTFVPSSEISSAGSTRSNPRFSLPSRWRRVSVRSAALQT
jgi:hypothetical protein